MMRKLFETPQESTTVLENPFDSLVNNPFIMIDKGIGYAQGPNSEVPEGLELLEESYH
jgi:hypothetical protein